MFWQEPQVVVEINSGGLYVSANRAEVITTLVGSCVAVCLFDAGNGVGGMNHFMLPYAGDGESPARSQDLRYGAYAMDSLLQGVLAGGGRAERLKAKVFGGGELIRTEQYNVAEANVKYALEYLEKRGIPVAAMDVGGCFGRKIYYRLRDHRVFVKKSRSVSQYGLNGV